MVKLVRVYDPRYSKFGKNTHSTSVAHALKYYWASKYSLSFQLNFLTLEQGSKIGVNIQLNLQGLAVSALILKALI